MDKEDSMIPKHINILGRKFKIKQLAKFHYQNEPHLGLCDYSAKTIYLEKEQNEEDKIDTLIHECCHAMLTISGVNQKLTDSENEILCQLVTALFSDTAKALKLK